MSVDLYVYLRDADIPTRAEWQQAIDEAGIDLVLDEEFSVREHEGGYILAQMGEEETGFEFDFESKEGSYVPSGPDAEEKIAAYDRVAAFRFGGDLQECVAAMYAAAILTQLTNGLFCDAQIGELVDGARAMEMAHEAAEGLSKG